MPFSDRWPGYHGGSKSDAIGLNIDFAPTSLLAAGQPVQTMQGRSPCPCSGRTHRLAAHRCTTATTRPGIHNSAAHYGVRTATAQADLL